MSKDLDWTHWSVHFGCGLAMGAYVGWVMIGKGRYNSSSLLPLIPEHRWYFLGGMALLAAGLWSLYGEKEWYSAHHTGLSRGLSVLTTMAGAAIAGGVIYLHFQIP